MPILGTDSVRYRNDRRAEVTFVIILITVVNPFPNDTRLS